MYADVIVEVSFCSAINSLLIISPLWLIMLVHNNKVVIIPNCVIECQSSISI